MTYKETFYKGFDAANKNILLVPVKMAATYALFIGFVIVLIIPIVVAALAFGTGMLASLKDLNINNIGELLSSKYLVLAVVIAAIVLVYITAASFVALYVYGGSCGMIAGGIRDEGFKFQMSGFFSEGKRFFGPVLGFTTIVGAVVIVILLLLVASVFPLKSIIHVLEGMNESLSMFMATLSVLVAAVTFLFLFAGTFAITFYGTAALVFKGAAATQAANEAVRFIFKRPSAFGFYMLCVVIYFSANVMIAGSVFGVALIPVIGTVMVFPYHLLVQAVQYYMGILFVAVLFSYYFGVEGQGSAPPISEMSTAAIDTSSGVPEPETFPAQQVDPDEGEL
ncbi:MAG: hypothetical protein HQK95_00625 [Nitrospirae bacterium]|nr:hypothetical protein [Nitrospirota bacterium]